jgi:hypothetical protein
LDDLLRMHLALLRLPHFFKSLGDLIKLFILFSISQFLLIEPHEVLTRTFLLRFLSSWFLLLKGFITFTALLPIFLHLSLPFPELPVFLLPLLLFMHLVLLFKVLLN